MTFGCDGRYAVGVIPKECTLVFVYRYPACPKAWFERTTKRTPAKYYSPGWGRANGFALSDSAATRPTTTAAMSAGTMTTGLVA